MTPPVVTEMVPEEKKRDVSGKSELCRKKSNCVGGGKYQRSNAVSKANELKDTEADHKHF